MLRIRSKSSRGTHRQADVHQAIMQILNSQQVQSCHLVRNNSGSYEYCGGIVFQNRMFIQIQLFLTNERKAAVDYCHRQYLAYRGARSYLLVEGKLGFTVWQEDKFARVAGRYEPENTIQDLNLESLLTEIETIGDRNLSAASPDHLRQTLQSALKTVIDLGQELMSEQ
ncbi:MAG: hypothetical protein AAFR63_11205 [Cyanobacteria bacterium J06631_6]